MNLEQLLFVSTKRMHQNLQALSLTDANQTETTILAVATRMGHHNSVKNTQPKEFLS